MFLGLRVSDVSTVVPDDFRATIVRVVAYIGGLAVLAVLAASFFRAPVRLVAAPAPQPEWVSVDRPHPAFELQLPDAGTAAAGYIIMRRPTDNARKDLMTWGSPVATGPYAMVEIYRPGARSERFIDAPSEIAARIVAFTVTDDVKPAGSIVSKFGTVPLVDFAIAAPGTAEPHRCLGFAKAFDAPSMQIAGWYCNGHDERVDHAMLACILDRLTILTAGGDAALAGLFARAEIRRTFCGARNPILAATPEREVQVPVPHIVRPHPHASPH